MQLEDTSLKRVRLRISVDASPYFRGVPEGITQLTNSLRMCGHDDVAATLRVNYGSKFSCSLNGEL